MKSLKNTQPQAHWRPEHTVDTLIEQGIMLCIRPTPQS